MTPELEQYALRVLADAVKAFPMGYEPHLAWRRMPVTAGVAIYSRRTIALSSVLMIDEERIRTTLLHEYAHLLAFHRHGRKGAGHGPAWRQAMVDLGLEPKVRHRYEVKRNQARQQVVYRCQKCGLEILKRRRLPSRRRYFHVGCGGQIKFLAVHRVTDETRPT